MYEVWHTPEFDEWLDGLDQTQGNRVVMAIYNIGEGNWGDYKPLAGANGVFERRLMGRGPGIRLYFCRQSRNVVLMLAGCDKAGQQRRDIARAQRIREGYR